MEITRRLKMLIVSALILIVACLDFGVISAPAQGELYQTKGTLGNIGMNVLCDACETVASTLQKLVETGVSETIIAKTAVALCDEFDIEDKYICSTIVPEFKDEVLYILANTALSSTEICGSLLGDGCGNTYDPFNQTWTIPIPGNQPPVKVKTPKFSAPINRILHLSDIHWDPQYTEGLTAQCGEPLCCRPPNAKAKTPEDAAGMWGDPHCDIPYRTLVNLMQQLDSIRDEFDWIYVTGDLPAHNDWTQTRDDQLKLLANVTTLFRKYLPGKPVYFTIGNHESAPVNSFPPPIINGKESESWLYNKAADEWADWLTPEAVKTLKYGGYYAMNVKPDLKVISLQTNYCNKDNWWLLINSTDPGNMLQWFSDELLDSESKGQKVHVIGHIPPGINDCLGPWSSVYIQLTERFQNTITGHFYGHVHTDSFMVLYSQNTQKPIGTLYLSPSITTYTRLHPGYRIYDIEGSYNGSTRLTLDHYTYIMNITEANLNNKPKWILEYSAKSAYNMSSLTDTEWDIVVNKFIEDDHLFQLFHKYFSKSFSSNQCTGTCKCSKLTDLVYNRHITCKESTKEEIRLYKQANVQFC